MSSSICLVINGVVLETQVPQASTFLETNPGAYTTTRTHNAASCILFWDRHMHRLAESARILANSKPEFFFGGSGLMKSRPFVASSSSSWESVLRPLVNDALRKVLTISMKRRGAGEELTITTLVSGNVSNLDSNVEGVIEEEKIFKAINVFVHVGVYVPLVFDVKENGARLAVVGHGRDVARAKFAEWVTIRKSLEKLRPPLTNELLLSNDGDQILEGCLTNFFVVCCKEKNDAEEYLSDSKSGYSFEVQTAPLNDGVLPGVIRQLVIEVCLSSGIPFREVSPRWSQRELWNEAFITNSLRVVQHVEIIQAPSSWELIEMKTWKEVNWEEICFKECPGIITSEIQKGIYGRADLEGYPISDFTRHINSSGRHHRF